MSDCGNVQKAFVPQKGTVPEVTPVASGIGISDLAAEKILRFLEHESLSCETHGLKIGVVKDGCSGNSYSMTLSDVASAVEAGDKIFEHNGAKVIVEKLSYIFIIGSTLDYKESLLASGFELLNPNVKKACSCGSSVAFKSPS